MNEIKNMDEIERLDRDHFMHPSTHLADFSRGDAPQRVIESGEGVYITDTKGKRSLDGFAGLYCVNVGYGRTEIADAISEQAHKLAYYHSYVGHATEASINLAKMIIDRAPADMSHVYFGLSGSDANETNIKLIWYYNNILGRPEKKKIISRWRGYHGSGVMTGSMTGLKLFHEAYDLPRAPIIHTDAPYYYHREDMSQTEDAFSQQCADNLEAMILREGPETIAAFIGEPILGTGGIMPPTKGYWKKIQAVLNKYDILLVADEVVTGFGRLGTMFGSDHYDIKPDLITTAKGLTSAYAPLSAVIISNKVWKVLEDGTDQMGAFGHGWTYSAHPIGAAAGVANLKLIDKLDLVGNARDVGKSFNNMLKSAFADHEIVGDIRGEGLMAALEFVENRDNRTFFDPAKKVGPRISAMCLERGLIARAMPQGDILGFAPPLCLSQDEASEIVRIAKEAVDAVAQEL